MNVRALRNPGKVAFNWDITCFEMDNPEEIQFKKGISGEYPMFFKGTFKKEENEIIVFETDGLKGSPCVEISDICGIPNHHEEIIV